MLRKKRNKVEDDRKLELNYVFSLSHPRTNSCNNTKSNTLLKFNTKSNTLLKFYS